MVVGGVVAKVKAAAAQPKRIFPPLDDTSSYGIGAGRFWWFTLLDQLDFESEPVRAA